MVIDYFGIGSSEVDWCETNYNISPHIAEFFNTVSNVLFFIIPPIACQLFKPYANHVTKGIYLIFLLLAFVGIGSVYFHSTLSLAGQLMDELLILWVVMISYAILMPIQFLPQYFKTNRNMYSLFVFVLTLIATLACLLKPYLNAYFLMLFSFPIMVLLVIRTKRSDKKIIKLGKKTVFVWIIAVVFWISDRVLCDLWIKINLPYFHSVFHLIAFYSSYWSIVLYSYFKAIDTVPHFKASITYWPEFGSNYHLFTIPYVHIATSNSSSSNNNNNTQYKFESAYKNGSSESREAINLESYKFA